MLTGYCKEYDIENDTDSKMSILPLHANKHGLLLVYIFFQFIKKCIVEVLEYIYIINYMGLCVQALKFLLNRVNHIIREGKKERRCPQVIVDNL